MDDVVKVLSTTTHNKPTCPLVPTDPLSNCLVSQTGVLQKRPFSHHVKGM